MTPLRLILILVLAAWNCSGSNVDEALIGALRWYHRWIATLPQRVASVDCKVAAFSESQFAYCQPGKLGIDIDTPRGSSASVVAITQVFSGFPEELTDFLNHRYPGPTQIPSVRSLSIPRSALSACKVDLEMTRHLAETAVGSRQRKEFLSRGITLRFPLACDGDPFYLVYFMRGGDVQWIWQFQPGMGLVWSYDPHNDQRKVPELALRNLARPEVWFEPL